MAGPHPPTLFVPGWSDTARALTRAQGFLLEAGWPADHVACVDFRNRYGSNIEHAAEIAAAVERLRLAACAARVCVVAHSMGGLAVREYLAGQGAAAPLDRVVFAGTPHRGTWMAWLAWGAGGVEMRPGSPFLRRLERTPLPSHVRITCIRTLLDTRVLPGSSAVLPGAPCHVLRAPTHPRLLRHRATLRLIQEVLQDAA